MRKSLNALIKGN